MLRFPPLALLFVKGFLATANEHPFGTLCEGERCANSGGVHLLQVHGAGRLQKVRIFDNDVADDEDYQVEMTPVGYKFFHDGHCAGGWIGHQGGKQNTLETTIGACASRCANDVDCAYF